MKRRDFLAGAAASFAVNACGILPQQPATSPPSDPSPSAPLASVARRKPKIGLALGGGAARGFVHIGVIKALETHGISADIVAGTSAGSVVGALYAAGYDIFDLQKLAMQIEESAFTDWSVFDRGFLRGEALERFINQQVSNKPLEGLKRRFAAVATDLASGETAVFTVGNVGTAVRASSAVPGVFAPVIIRSKEYVDGGLSSPVPAKAARALGADIVIAVDISGKPSGRKNLTGIDLLIDTIAIMGSNIADYELREADFVIRPDLRGLPVANFAQRHDAILQGERAGFAIVHKIKERIAAFK